MAGRKRYLKGSIQARLSIALLVAVVVLALIAGTFSFYSAFDEAHERQDDVLYQVMGLAEVANLPITSGSRYIKLGDADDDSFLFVHIYGKQGTGTPGSHSPDTVQFSPALSNGLHTVKVKGTAYRILYKTLGNGNRVVVAQDTDIRDDIATNGALRTLAPFLVFMPIVLIIIAILVRRMFQPIVDISREIDARSETDLKPVVNPRIPREVRPFIRAINRLLTRVAESVEVQRRFVADAAHELRSPLTALALQAESLEQASMSNTARERLERLHQGIERNRNLLDQLLTLARAQSPGGQGGLAISVHEIYRRVLEDLLPLAETRHIDIGMVGAQDALVAATELDLTALVKNLVDNAIRYTPEGGRVDLSVMADKGTVVMRVSDSGPGITPTDRTRVFDAFYRVLGNDQQGSGLGLSIVKTIADRIGARVRLTSTDAATGTGLTVLVTFPGNGEIPA